MNDVPDAFELCLTLSGNLSEELRVFAEGHGAKFSHLLLDRGTWSEQAMVTVPGHGTVEQAYELMNEWWAKFNDDENDDLYARRTKIGFALSHDVVPENDDRASQEYSVYFEQHVKVVLPDVSIARLIALYDMIAPYEARLSRNVRRDGADTVHERFITQRCRYVGRVTAQQRFEEMVTALRAHGADIVEVQQMYVNVDNCVEMDSGWLTGRYVSWDQANEDLMRAAPAGAEDYPSTYQPIGSTPGVFARGAFDPALKQFMNAYRAGEPRFADEEVGRRWRAARETAMAYLLNLIATSPWADHLVLRGSTLLRVWLGEAARDPGDLDFVVIPEDLAVADRHSLDMLDGIVGAVHAFPGAGLHADGVAAEDIWTYDRVPGRRLTFPFSVAGLPSGTVQLDFVFNEVMPMPPVAMHMPQVDVPVLAATPELSLAWKLMWLHTDGWPQGKDLYDATLLAEHTSVSADLIRDLLRPECGSHADYFSAASVLSWTTDWRNFRDEYPDVHGDGDLWQRRLALALAPAFGESGP